MNNGCPKTKQNKKLHKYNIKEGGNLLPGYDSEERRLLEIYDAQDSELERNDWENGFELEKEWDNVPNEDVWT